MKYLFKYIKSNKWYMIIGPFFTLIQSVLELINPLLMAKIIDQANQTKDVGIVLRYSLLIAFFTIVIFIMAILAQKFASILSTKISKEMRKDVFEKVSKFSHSELDKFGSASLINRLTDDVFQIETSVGRFMRVVIRLPFLLIGSFVLSLIINVKMSLVFLILIPIISIILVLYIKKTNPYFYILRNKLDNISKITKENLSGTRVIRAFNKQHDEQNRFNDASLDYTKTSIKISKISSLLNPLFFLIVDMAILGLLAMGGWQINVGAMTQGDIIALIDYVTIVSVSLLLLSQIIIMFVRTSASIKRVSEVLDTEISIKFKNSKHKILNFDTIIEFKNVCFNYSQSLKDRMFIKDLSFKIYPNQTLGIIGGTGSGKTTVANLLLRFYDATQGKYYLKEKI